METKSLSGRERLQQASEASLRVEALVDIASLIAADCFEVRLDGPIEDLIDYLTDDAYQLHPSAKVLSEVARQTMDGDEGATDMLGEMFVQRGLLGLAVHFATPVMQRMGKSFGYSWGYTQSTWIYAETYEQAWAMGVAWAEKCREESQPAPKRRSRRIGTKAASGDAA